MSPELFLAVLGLRRILGVAPLKPTKGDITAALRLPKEIKTMAEAFTQMETTPQPKPLTFQDLTWIKDALRDVDPVTLLQGVLPQLHRAEIDIGIGSAIADLVAYLQDQMPKGDVLEGGIFQAEAPEASKSDDFRFLWTCRLVDNPLHLLTLMQTGQLTKRDSAALQDTFPDILQMISDEVVGTAIDSFKPGEFIPRPVKLMTSVLLQVPVTSAKTLQAYGKQDPIKPGPPAESESPDIANIEG